MKELISCVKEIFFILSCFAVGTVTFILFVKLCAHGFVILDQKLSSYPNEEITCTSQMELVK